MSNRFTLVALMAAAGLATVAGVPPSVQASTVHRSRSRILPTRGAAGTISGTIVDAASRVPVAAAQVTIIGTTLGAMSDAQGRYRLIGVPVGTAVVRVRRIGYGSGDRSVTLTDGAAAPLDLPLTPAGKRRHT